MIIRDNFPNNGINHIHHMVLEHLADEYQVIADGTRREDRIPKLKFSEIQSLEDRKGIQYLNLTGIGYKTINDTSDRLFTLQKSESNIIVLIMKWKFESYLKRRDMTLMKFFHNIFNQEL